MPDGPFEILLNPGRISFAGEEVLLDLELLLVNRSGEAADDVRVAFGATSARPDQDALSARFHSGPPGQPAGPPFDLAAGEGTRLPVRLAMPRAGLHVVTVAGRPMFVPLVLVDLRWRGGLSIRRFGGDFLLGTPGQGGKLGPIWLDRPAPAGPLAANRYAAKAVALA